MRKPLHLIFASACLLLVVSAVPLMAQAPPSGASSSLVPRLIKFSGVAKDTDGMPRSGVIGITFALYKDEHGGAPLWLETQNVQADAQGHYSVYLGATASDGLPQELFVSGDARWLGVQPEGRAEQPRTLLLSVPYALKAGDAETIGGLPPSAFVLAAPPTASGATPPSSPLTSPSSGIQPDLGGGGTVNFVPLWTPDGNTLGNSVMFQSGSGASAKIGINTTTPVNTLDVKGTATIRGALSLPATGQATAAAGKNSQPTKLTASAFKSTTNAAINQTFQWQAEPVGNNTSNPSGSLNLLFGSGSGQPAETGLKIASNGQLSFAPGQTFPGVGTISGVTAGTDLTGGGSSGNVTLNLDTTKVPQLNVANIFTGNQTVNGNLSATGLVSGSAFNIGSDLFASGSFFNSNAFLGFAGNTTTTGYFNTAVGMTSLSFNTTGIRNTAVGGSSLYFNTAGSFNTASGLFALFSNSTGSFNTASGVNALYSNTTADQNTAMGNAALYNNTTGFINTAIGNGALFANTTGDSNTASGAEVLSANTTGAWNTASGYSALAANSTGSQNTASGFRSLYNNTTGSFNSGFGYLAGPPSSHPDLTNATAIGANAEVDASNSLVLGSISGVNGALASAKVGIGTTTPQYSLDVHGTGNFTGLVTFATGQTFPGTGTITGVTAGTDLVGGGSSGNVTLNVDTTKVVTAVLAGTDLTGGGTGGVQTLNLDTTKVPQLNAANTFTGNQTVNGNLSATGLVTGIAFNIGSNLFASGSYTNANAFLGFAGNTTTTGLYNTASGFGALALNISGGYNSASGAYALQHNTTGNGNTADGQGAMQSNTTGSNNTASGASALPNNTVGSYNTASGVSALFANTIGGNNTASGYSALGSNTTGSYNTASGFLALNLNETGSFNSAMGFNAGPSFPDLNNATAIGAYAEVDASNSLVLGSINGVAGATADTNVGIGVTVPTYRLHIGAGNNTFRVEGPAQGTANPLIASFGGAGDFAIDAPFSPAGRFVVKDNGNVGIGVASPSRILVLRSGGGHAIADGWDTYSSRRWKTHIRPLNDALGKVEQLRGVSYDRKDSGKHEIGVIAEEVGQVVPEIVTYEANGKDAQGVDYSRLTALLIEAVKQQQRQIRQQHALLQAQSAALRGLKSELRETRQSLKKIRAQVEAAREYFAPLNSATGQLAHEWTSPDPLQ